MNGAIYGKKTNQGKEEEYITFNNCGCEHASQGALLVSFSKEDLGEAEGPDHWIAFSLMDEDNTDLRAKGDKGRCSFKLWKAKERKFRLPAPPIPEVPEEEEIPF